ncbi:MAG TPA: BON domain-containing protein [Armatimonadota bacterium]|nr:BON domain-containing protein [Armatimonadota bacterium]HOM71216.1 BON domain-containing protein [Armatimonadota bacterium]HPP75849.1 BON domain-containing protein [Armatimonadota bacterium]
MEALRDRALLESVRTRLMEDTRLAGQPIEVTASDGYIQLLGGVDSDDDKTLAEEIALGVSGVRAVENRLEVRGEAAS